MFSLDLSSRSIHNPDRCRLRCKFRIQEIDKDVRLHGVLSAVSRHGGCIYCTLVVLENIVNIINNVNIVCAVAQDGTPIQRNMTPTYGRRNAPTGILFFFSSPSFQTEQIRRLLPYTCVTLHPHFILLEMADSV